MSQATLLLVHGWGLGAGTWRPFLRLLDNPPHHCLDLGFYGAKQTDLPPDTAGDGPLIAVGHSLGFLWILHHMSTAPWADRVQGLIAINGFSRFSQADDFPHGVQPCLLRRMKNGLFKDPVKVLRNFRELGGAPPGEFLSEKAKKNLDAMALAYGLGWLLEWDGRLTLNQWKKPLLVIANQDDAIVTPAITEASFSPLFDARSTQVRWLEGGGHMGLLTHPQAYAALVGQFYSEHC